MRLKKESRILVIDSVEGYVAALVLRGVVGVEEGLVFDNCSELVEFIERGRDVAGEINYLVDLNNVCRELNVRTRVGKAKKLVPNDLDDPEIRESIKEADKVFKILKAKLVALLQHTLSRT